MSALNTLIDETTNIKNELITCYTNLKNNLIEKGVECSDKDKFENLVSKINLISVGKKWASGISVMGNHNNKFYGYNGGSLELGYCDIYINAFTPRLIVAISEDQICIYIKEKGVTICTGYNGYINHSTYSSSYKNSSVISGDTYKLPFGGVNIICHWMAFE